MFGQTNGQISKLDIRTNGQISKLDIRTIGQISKLNIGTNGQTLPVLDFYIDDELSSDQIALTQKRGKGGGWRGANVHRARRRPPHTTNVPRSRT